MSSTITLSKIQEYNAHGYDLTTIGQSECGRMPIFYLEVSAKWKSKQNQKEFDLAVKLLIVYKGPGQPLTSSKGWMDQMKKIFFTEYLLKTKEPSEIQKSTFTIVSFKPLKFLGYENEPGLT
jgi:hypothetical protein